MLSSNQNERDQIDVTVIGGGLAGMAASIHLSRAGLRVLCIEADVADTDPVGESLDWSAPDLLKTAWTDDGIPAGPGDCDLQASM
jgi:flavin-dependent dehydrogenase